VGILLKIVDGANGANTCRHRAHELLAAGEANDPRALVCSHHGWSYELDGRRGRLREWLGGFDGGAYGLIEMPVVPWHRWMFGNAAATVGQFGIILARWPRVTPYRRERCGPQGPSHV
jgi:Rieske 2Fe-2S family protein